LSAMGTAAQTMPENNKNSKTVYITDDERMDVLHM
jgi:hypothetical protein